MENKGISLVVVDCVSPYIEEYGSIALTNIQDLARFKLINKIYELFSGLSSLEHNGVKIKQDSGNPVDISGVVSSVIPGEIILTGGSLGNEHYDVFVHLLEGIRAKEQASNIHIPFDCTYSFEWKYDSGDSWKEGCLGDVKMPVFEMYREAAKKHGGCIVEPTEKYKGEPKIITLDLWNEWKMMADYLTAKNQTNLDRGKGND